MIELKDNKLLISFPEVHKDAYATIEFKRTLRIQNDEKGYTCSLPDWDISEFRNVKDCANEATQWQEKGGAMMPMYQSEALLMAFEGDYPIAVKVGIGGINAINGSRWLEGLSKTSNQPIDSSKATAKGAHINQNYVIIPQQSRLDYFCDDKGQIAQLVATPIGFSETANEQINGSIAGNEILIEAFPIKFSKWEEILEERCAHKDKVEKYGETSSRWDSDEEYELGITRLFRNPNPNHYVEVGSGHIKQTIKLDPYITSNWLTKSTSRYRIKLCNTELWGKITSEKPISAPFSAKDYINHGIPWFKHYAEKSKPKKIKVSKVFKKILSYITTSEKTLK